jgi:hypothetical protein
VVWSHQNLRKAEPCPIAKEHIGNWRVLLFCDDGLVRVFPGSPGEFFAEAERDMIWCSPFAQLVVILGAARVTS